MAASADVDFRHPGGRGPAKVEGSQLWGRVELGAVGILGWREESWGGGWKGRSFFQLSVLSECSQQAMSAHGCLVPGEKRRLAQ